MTDTLQNPKSRIRYLPIFELRVGMTLARPVVLSDRGRAILTLPEGLVLGDAVLDQLIAHKAEYACVVELDPRSEAERRMDQARTEDRIHHIFRRARLEQASTESLRNALLDYRRVG